MFLNRLQRCTDELRAVAIILIIAFHVLKDALPQLLADSPLQPYTLLLNFGVDIFVLLSGFGLTLSLLSSPQVSWGRWAWRRFLRIFPVYWLIFGAVMIVAFWLGDGERLYVERLRPVESENIWLAAVGLHGFYRPFMYRIYGPFWFISLILLCYLAFIPLSAIIRRARLDWLIAVGLAVALLGCLAAHLYPRAVSPVPYLAFLNFPLGAALAVLTHRITQPVKGKAQPLTGDILGPAVVFLLMCLFLLLATRYGSRMFEFYTSTREQRMGWSRSPFDDSRYFMFPALGLSTVMLVVALCPPRARGLGRNALAWLGRHSFELFLLHMPLITALRADRLWPDAISAGPATALGLGLSLLLAVPLRLVGLRLQHMATPAKTGLKHTGALALVALATLTSAPLTAQQRELTTQDRTAALYSTRFTFNEDNVPSVSIALMDDQETVRIDSPGRLKILPMGPDGPEVFGPEGRSWTARIVESRPAEVRYWVVLARFSAHDMSGLRSARERYKEEGLELTKFEVGSVFGFFGEVLDSRAVLLAIDEPHEQAAAARAAAETASTRFGHDCSVHAVLDKPAGGTIILEDTGGNVTVRARDVLWLKPSPGAPPLRVRDVEYGRFMGNPRREDRVYRGMLYLAVGRTGRLALVNQADAETVLRGIVPSEIFPSAPPAALRAQAVVARGELMSKIGTRHMADPYLLCADVHCQAYRGVALEDRRTDRAVSETRGQILFGERGLSPSVYSASCGGHTEDNDQVWPGSPHPHLRGVQDGPKRPDWMPKGALDDTLALKFLTERAPPEERPWCGRTKLGREHYRWQRTLDAKELERHLSKRFPGLGTLRDIRVLSRGASGRARELGVAGTGGRFVVERELPIRRALGNLKSALFVIETERDPDGRPRAFKITGGGFGHGVGMCQVGAIGMAEAGHDYRKILEHYYSGASPKKIY